MKLTGISCLRYKKFKDSTYLPIAPLTIIIGKNGSGKSVISRLPMVLAGSVSLTSQGIIDLNAGGVWHARSLHDLIFERSGLPFSLGATVADSTRNFSFECTLRYVNETKRLAVEIFNLKSGDEELLRLELRNLEELPKVRRTYHLHVQGAERTAEITWHGLLPDIDQLGLTGSEEEIGAIIGEVRAALSMPAYLGPFRAEIVGRGRFPHQGVSSLGPKGERTIDFLADDKLRNSGVVCNDVEKWFTETLGGGIDTDVSGDVPIVQVTASDGRITIDFSDTGAGYSQCLPVVVQNLAAQRGRLDSSMLVVEQPELHLHPAAHGAIADLYIQSAVNGAVCFVETHSEQFISRVRRRIAEGLIPAGSVQLISIDHAEDDEADSEPFRLIEFDDRGQPSCWPYGVFEESLDDFRKLREAARSRGL
ncbi:AAA family ATPase [Stenotrophomonas rhizophila]|uniref:ABC-type cobalamin/Fe3+-siderophores transport system ATPase subunit n=1 Tax=Stenotrophomonas rhizophila TaxID=216778 RepID=A0AAW5PMY9_9GAMM|nr:AAA family ATPase [Stenotrophomonas rhizophila]MCS4281103.1 ABC-type cobalamin/Fe3+-siderophores transport system ATPase subunit [Stenotrophomonas rhizophila]